MSVRTDRGGVDVTSRQPLPHQAVNGVLSEARADAIKAFLEQDVEAWLGFYDEQGATSGARVKIGS